MSAVLVGLLIGPTAQAAAQPGQLDPAFGGGTVLAPGVPLLGVAVRSDGSVVAGGTDGAARVLQYTSGGGLASSAGGTGPVARAVAIQSDGKTVVAGGDAGSGSGMVVERFNGSSPDSSFGSSGVVTLLGGSSGVANAVAVGPDGKIVVAGSEVPAGGDGTSRVAVARLNPNGSLDASFGGGGVVILDFSSFSVANGVAVQPDGKIVLVGSQRPGFQVTNGFIARLNQNGSLDSAFGSSANPNIGCSPGVCVYWHPGGGAYSSMNAVALQNDGKIVAAGVDIRSQNDPGQPPCNTYDCPQAVVVRLSAGGATDPSFSSGSPDGAGVAALPSGSQSKTGDPTGAYGVGIGGGGAIIAAGDYEEGGTGVGLWAFSPSGSPDTAFGTGGTVITPLDGQSHGRALAVSSDGSLLVSGQTGTGGFVERYVGLGPPPPPTPPPVVVTGAASAVTHTSATVAGQVNPNGLATTYRFEYGPTSAYGSSTHGASAGSGNALVGVSATLAALIPGGTYHYRLDATSSAGTVHGADRTFMTAAPAVPGPPLVETGAASAVGQLSATAHGRVNPDGLASSYHAEYGRTTGYGSHTRDSTMAAGTSAVAVSRRLTGLLPGTTYHYRLVATNSSGTAYGADRTFKTAPRLRTTIVGLGGSYRLSGVINGITLGVGCNQGCSVRASLLLPASVAKRLGLAVTSARRVVAKPVVIGTGSASRRRKGAVRLTVSLTATAKRTLATNKQTLGVTLRIVTTPANSGRAVTVSNKLSLIP